MKKITATHINKIIDEVNKELEGMFKALERLPKAKKPKRKAKVSKVQTNKHPGMAPFVDPSKVTYKRLKGIRHKAEDLFNDFWDGKDSVEFQTGINKMVVKK